MRTSAARSVGLAVGLLLVGAAIGALGAFVQAARLLVTVGDLVIPVPWGAVLVLFVLFVVIRGGVQIMQSRWGGAAVLTGWLLLTVAFAVTSPSGDIALSGGARQLVYLFGGTAVGSALATFPVRRSQIAGNSDVP